MGVPMPLPTQPKDLTDLEDLKGALDEGRDEGSHEGSNTSGPGSSAELL